MIFPQLTGMRPNYLKIVFNTVIVTDDVPIQNPRLRSHVNVLIRLYGDDCWSVKVADMFIHNYSRLGATCSLQFY